MDWLTAVQWSPYAAGIGIGILSWFTWLISSKPIGCSTSFARTAGMIEKLFRGKKVEGKLYYREVKPENDWQWMFVLGIIGGALVSSLLSGDFGWQWIPANGNGIRNICGCVIAALSAAPCYVCALGGGCTSGHGITEQCSWLFQAGFRNAAFSSGIAMQYYFQG
jgi:hypothetical protein